MLNVPLNVPTEVPVATNIHAYVLFTSKFLDAIVVSARVTDAFILSSYELPSDALLASVEYTNLLFMHSV